MGEDQVAEQGDVEKRLQNGRDVSVLEFGWPESDGSKSAVIRMDVSSHGIVRFYMSGCATRSVGLLGSCHQVRGGLVTIGEGGLLSLSGLPSLATEGSVRAQFFSS